MVERNSGRQTIGDRANRIRIKTISVSLFAISILLIAPWATAETAIHVANRSLALFPPRFTSVATTDSQPAVSQKPPDLHSNSTGYRLSPELYQKAIAFSRAKYRLYFIRFAYEVAILVFVLSIGLAPKFRDWAERSSHRRIGQVLIFSPLMVLTLAFLQLPTSIYSHSLQLEYGQSVQSWPSWFWDFCKSEMLQIAVATFLIWLLFGIICRSARKWWFYFWLASIPLTIFMMFVEPVLIDPLFNKFEPLSLRRPDLVAQLGQVAKRGRLPVPESRMFEMKASEKVTSINAYVAGIGASKRIVVWDTTIAHLSTPEILFVFGHEMGHYVLRHIPKGMALSAVGTFLGLYFVFLAMNRLLANRGPKWKIRGCDDLASLPLLLLLAAMLSFVGSPIENGVSRYFEHQADIYGLEVIHGIVPDPQNVAVQSFQRLGEIDLSDPNPSPFIKIWLFSHPPITERIEFARSYDPWSKGQAALFVK